LLFRNLPVAFAVQDQRFRVAIERGLDFREAAVGDVGQGAQPLH